MIRRFNTALLVVAILLGCSTLSLANPAGGQTGQKIKDALAQLDLTTAQKHQIRQIVTEARSSAKAGGKNEGAGKEVMKKIMSVLTPEQKAKLKQILKSSRTSKA